VGLHSTALPAGDRVHYHSPSPMSPGIRLRLAAWLDTRLSAGARASVRRLSEELTIQRRHRASVRRARSLRGQRHLKLHLGSGRKYLAGWVNVDFDRDADLQLDLRERLPFEDGSVAVIYSEHLFEHIAYPAETSPLLRESLRVLEPGGLFSVGVPDAGEALRQYATGELAALLPRWATDPALRWVEPEVWTTPMHYVNWVFRQEDEHRYAYDDETLVQVLHRAGFVHAHRRPFDAARDSEHRRNGTLYVDARKPG
jgi:predicted SAM-dependent methyltransferase